MKITQLDSFSEGFTVKPRPAHKNPVKRVKSEVNTLGLLRKDLVDKGLIRVEDYKHRASVIAGIGWLRMNGWIIESKLDGRKVVTYRLIKAK